MQHTITFKTYSHEAVESCIDNLRFELDQFADTAKEHAERKEPITFAYFRHTIHEPVFAVSQEAINTIKQKLHPGSAIVNAKQMEQHASGQSHDLLLDINNCRRKKDKKKLERNWLCHITASVRQRRFLFIGCILAALSDGILAYANLRQLYPSLIALGIAAAFGISIFAAHLLAAPWILKARSPKIRLYRIIGVLSVAAVFFFIVGSIRGSAASGAINISLETFEEARTPNINPLPLAISSLLLFTIVLFASMRVHHSKWSDANEKKYKELSSDIRELDEKIAAMETKRSAIEQTVLADKRKALVIYEYCLTCIETCKQLARQAIATYKQEYLRRSNSNQVPLFFNDELDLQFDDNIQFFNSKTSAR